MAHINKAILLAGGAGSRLYPLTAIVSKQLQPVYDKPMIYYPLTMLLENRIRSILLISMADQLPFYQRILGDGSRFGIQLEYAVQDQPRGIAEALLIAAPFIRGEAVALALGDNIFYGAGCLNAAFDSFQDGATIFAYQVHDPEHYGVVEFAWDGSALSLEEKPAQPKSSYVVPGLYLYDQAAVELAGRLRPSARGELEITDLNLLYLQRKKLRVIPLPRGFAWLDAGTSSSLHEASSFVQTLEKRQGMKIGCPEEAALRAGLIDAQQFAHILRRIPGCEYRDYLEKIAAEPQFA